MNISVLSSTTGVSLPSPWQLDAYNNPESHAAVTNGEFRVKSAGNVIYGTSDHFTYVWQPLVGAQNASITATISRFAARNGAAVAGVAFRAADAQSTENVTLRVQYRGETAVSYLRGSEAGFLQGISGIPLNEQDITVKLVKEGSTVTAYYLDNGQWYPFADVNDMNLPDNLLVGLVLTSEAQGDLAEAVFKNVAVTVGGDKGVVREYWTGAGNGTVSNIPLTEDPSGTLMMQNLEGPANIGDYYGARIRGYIHPPATGSYTFRIASDDHSELWLSTDADPANKVKIASVTGWTPPKDWTKYPSQQSSAISLTAGQKYYVEVLHKENAGNDHVAVGWTGPGISTVSVIANAHLSPYTGVEPDTQAPAAPTNVSAPSKTDTTVNLSWTGSSDNVGVTGYDVYVGGNKANGSPISGTTYTVTGLTETTAYSITVKARDAAGNESAASSALSVTTNGGGGTGSIDREYWAGVAGGAVTDIPLTTTPTSTSALTSLEGPTNVAESYGARVRGYIHPASTGTYTFYVASDDASELWLSTDANPANKVKLAEVTSWTGVREWNKFTTQQSAAVTLTAGQKYYVEVLHKEGAGNDHFSVGWTRPGKSTIDVITGTYLSPYADTQAPTAPTNVSAPSKTDTTVNLSWTASTDNVGVAGYTVYIGGNPVSSLLAGTSYTVAGLTENTAYSITVKAKDAAGNESAASSALSVTTNGGGGTGSIDREYWAGVAGGAVTDIPL
ncbi:MAG TPA: PA14 domain-containing protein, partial [Paenibacillus sp.]|nr:PA14 domain-containing protein [Paenibacillus sp.]